MSEEIPRGRLLRGPPDTRLEKKVVTPFDLKWSIRRESIALTST